MPALDAAADDQARFMALSLHAAHASPLYGQRTALDRVRRHGVEVGDLAENVASLPVGLATEPKAAATIAAALVSAWMKSPGHRANLLNRTFTHAGCAARLAHGFGKVDYVFGAQVFLKPAAPDLKL